LTALLLTLCSVAASADDLLVFKLQTGQYAAIKSGSSGLEIVGVFDNAVVIEQGPVTPPQPPVTPAGTGQLICVRPWSCTLEESDADLTIRESIDAVASKVPYIRLLPGTLDQRMQLHPAERYRSLVADQSKAWIFHVVPTAGQPTIAHQGPINADVALGWIGVKRVAFAAGPEVANEAKWLDMDFSKQQGETLGALELPPNLQREAIAAAQNVNTLPGFKPIPKGEWAQWVARFPVTRLAKSIRNITEQTMGSCVGHCCANEIEAGMYHTAGDLFFRRISGMSMYVRIGRSPGSGAYIPDAADEIFARGILPVTGEPYQHTFAQDTGFSTKLASGWEETGKFWKALVYSTDDPESGFRVGMDLRLGRQIGRSSHSICAGGYTGKSWWYENSWGVDWGDLGKSIGYDSSFYSGFVYQPVLRDEIPVLLARELPAARDMPSTAMTDAAKEFSRKIQDIIKRAESLKVSPAKKPVKAAPAPRKLLKVRR
jgi:hypothetical protein